MAHGQDLALFLSSSSDDSDGDDCFLFEFIGGDVNCRCHFRIRIPRVQNFVKTVIDNYNEQEFRGAFRLRRTAFEYLINILGPHLHNQNPNAGNDQIEPRKQVLMTLWFLAKPLGYRSLTCMFGVGNATAWRCVHRVIKVIYRYRNAFITWPTAQEQLNVSNRLQERFGFPGIVGFVDATEIEILAPAENSEAWFNRKRFPSVKLQVMSNPQRKIKHAFCGMPGAVHDMRLFRYSGLQDKCAPPFLDPQTHLLADSAYTLQENIMVRYRNRGDLTVEETYFNSVISTIRSSVERAIGLLKCRWRILLDKFPMRRLDLIPFYIISCCVLHNIALMTNEEFVLPVAIPERNNHGIAPLFPTNQQMRLGREKRQFITDNLNNDL